MALSGSFNGTCTGTSASKYTFQVVWSATQNIANNTSTVTATSYLWRNDGVSASAYDLDVSADKKIVSIAGTEYKSSSKGIDTRNGKKVTIATGTKTITHNSDGTKSITISSSFPNFAGTVGSGSASKSITLDTIPRKATIKSFTATPTSETALKLSFTADSTVDYIWYSTNDGSSWTGYNVTDGTSGSVTVSGLSVGTTYKCKLRVRRKESQLTTDSSTVSASTYSYPYASKTPDFTIGDKVTITLYNPMKRSATVNLIADGTSTTIQSATTTGTSVTFDTSTAKDTYYSKIPSATSKKYKVSVTYSGNTTTKSLGNVFKANATDSKPVWSGTITYADSNDVTKAVTEDASLIVQGLSTVRFAWTFAEAKNGASISKYTVKAGTLKEVSTPDGSTNYLDIGTLNTDENLTVTLIATDSRGYTVSRAIEISVAPYYKPSVTFTAERINNYEDDTIINARGNIASVGGKNDKVLKYRYKKTDEVTWSNYIALTDYVDTTQTLDKDYAFTVEVVITDRFNATGTATLIVPKGKFPLFIDTGINAVGINEFPADGEALRIAGGKLLIEENMTILCDAQKSLAFESKVGGTHNHNTYFYGGNPESTTALGCYDKRNSQYVFIYNDLLKRLSFGNGDTPIEFVVNGEQLDYVVEQGTKNNWYYRKWNSGYLECHYNGTVSVAINTANGNVYYGDSSAYTFPIEFKELPTVVASVSGTSTTNAWGSVHTLSVTSCKMRLFRGSSSASASYRVSITARGKWK